ncbi:MAG: ABC transporter ATP-binding protein [Coriobacteriia bacterium]
MISLEHVTKRYGDRIAVNDLTLEVPDGEVCVLIGPSGCGKTTTLRMINRLIEPTSGRILVDGVDTSTLPAEELRRHIGYAIQSVGLFPHMTVAENIATVPRLLGWKPARIRPRVMEMLELAGLDANAYAEKYPRELSGGEAQRVGVARALAGDPPVLLMDEPFGAVDPLNRDRLQAEFARIQRELRKTVVFVTHDADEAIRLADRIALMREGRLQQHDTPEALLDHPANRFVHDFMGADAALKRLARVPVRAVMRMDAPIAHVRDSEAIDSAECDGERFVYLADGNGKLVGWVDCRALVGGTASADAVTRVSWRQTALQPDASLREALARMLSLGYRAVPVVDADGHLLGDISFAEVEAALAGGDARIAPPPGDGDADNTADAGGIRE